MLRRRKTDTYGETTKLKNRKNRNTRRKETDQY